MNNKHKMASCLYNISDVGPYAITKGVNGTHATRRLRCIMTQDIESVVRPKKQTNIYLKYSSEPGLLLEQHILKITTL